jgi:hypothetical protein
MNCCSLLLILLKKISEGTLTNAFSKKKKGEKMTSELERRVDIIRQQSQALITFKSSLSSGSANIFFSFILDQNYRRALLSRDYKRFR